MSTVVVRFPVKTLYSNQHHTGSGTHLSSSYSNESRRLFSSCVHLTDLYSSKAELKNASHYTSVFPYIYIYIYIYIYRTSSCNKAKQHSWGRDMTPKTKTHIYHVTVKITITYAAETGCLKSKNGSKTNSHRNRIWRRSARISRKDKLRNTIIKQKTNVVMSLLGDIKTKQLQWYGHVKRM